MLEVRRASWARLRRRSSADGSALLHQFRFAQVRASDADQRAGLDWREVTDALAAGLALRGETELRASAAAGVLEDECHDGSASPELGDVTGKLD